MKNKVYLVGIAAFLLVWFGLTGAAWFGKAEDYSKEERKVLSQAPKLSMDTLLAKDEINLKGEVVPKSYKTLFENYSLDQFPLRQPLRRVKAMFSSYVMGQLDEDGFYAQEGYAAEWLYPLDEKNLNRNIKIIQGITEKYLGRNKVYTAVIPDKGYFLADQYGYPNVDYNQIFQAMQDALPKDTYIDLTQVLKLEDYYYSDTHWAQEKIVPAAQKIGETMGTTMDGLSAYTLEKLDQPYYGVYYGAALPMKADTMYLMHSAVLDGCTVKRYVSKGETPERHTWEEIAFYDMSKAVLNEDNRDLYNIFFSDNQTMIEITNPKGPKGKELIVFGDSYARSMVPLLVSGYSKVTLIDMRKVNGMSGMLEQFVRFKPGKDVLFLYGTVSLTQGIA